MGEKDTVILEGMKEFTFLPAPSSLAKMMTLQRLFVTLTQRVLTTLHSRMHYGHPDVFDKLYIMTNGGVNKV
jgi:callose synthase